MATVSISDTSPRVQYSVSATPTTGPFTVSFPFFDLDDLVVYDGETLLVRTTDYTVSGTAVDDGYSGGTVTLVSSTSNTTITILRDIPVERTTDFPTSGYFSVAALNTALDKIFAILQQIETGVARTLRLKDTAGNSVTLTVDDPEAGKVLEWNSSGTGIQNSTISLSDVGTNATNAAASASAASTSATAAATSATAAAVSATSASASAAAAAASAAAVSGVSGPVSSTDNTWPRFDGTSGNQIQAGTWVEDDSGDVTAGGRLNMNGEDVDNANIDGSGTTENAITHSISGALAIDVTNGHYQTVTVSANVTSISLTGQPTGKATSVYIEAINWGSATITLTGIFVAGGTAPTFTASGTDKLSLVRDAGGTLTLTVINSNVSAAA